MSLDQNPTYAAPDDWRAYSGVLSRRVFAFLIDYAIVLLLCIPAAVIVFFLGVITLGLGLFLYPALFVIVAVLYFGMTLGGPSQATPGMRAMGIAMARMDGRRIDFLLSTVHIVLFWIINSVLTPLILLAGLFTERSRLVHDFLLGTVIVRTR
ncbi:UNVERIFIED_ORG: putative RDD family membrane protein YckC [Rhizobium sp. SORGH_AS260]|uniref:RDD family protein n=1 Tax=Agrobacterium sp. SORGH_AS_0440 TaxID=3041757 RepID=UPI002785EBFD|nr:RDD family protein [Agrobacterium sp. SORGH_AS_0440]MDP9732903.1 putative RDD family membrane protein YckC [Rhizobium sp. SORGH_AS_0285]MDP9755267.1 putative RDD family membrane protein YckC [Rhizobium sp. SORGH_AS_0260]MDR6082076.1 putative RDD family membrane protein YckC [Agrobacterium sp. SORGH_AS_0440]